MKYTRPRTACHVAKMKEGRNAFDIFTGKLTGKRPRRRNCFILITVQKIAP